jgi:hypothetical protein
MIANNTNLRNKKLIARHFHVLRVSQLDIQASANKNFATTTTILGDALTLSTKNRNSPLQTSFLGQDRMCSTCLQTITSFNLVALSAQPKLHSLRSTPFKQGHTIMKTSLHLASQSA